MGNKASSLLLANGKSRNDSESARTANWIKNKKKTCRLINSIDDVMFLTNKLA